MVAFYAWTDALLINSLRVKVDEYPEEAADLFVLTLNRVSRALLAQIEAKGVFRKIVLIDEPDDCLPRLVHKVVKPLSGRRYYESFRRQLGCVEGERYRILHTGGFWSYTLFLYEYLSESCPDMEIAFVEEGIASYGSADTLFWCDPLSERRNRIMREMFYGKVYERAKAAAKSIYLFCPQASLAGNTLCAKQIHARSGLAEELVGELNTQVCAEAYDQRDVIFFLQPEDEGEMSLTRERISLVVEVFGGENVIVKPHPDSAATIERLMLDPKVYVERPDLPFEQLLHRVDWEKKLLITKGTSCVFYPMYTRGQQPTVLFLFRQYPHTRLKEQIIAFSDRLRELYDDHDNVQCPEDLCQLRESLVAWRDRK